MAHKTESAVKTTDTATSMPGTCLKLEHDREHARTKYGAIATGPDSRTSHLHASLLAEACLVLPYRLDAQGLRALCAVASKSRARCDGATLSCSRIASSFQAASPVAGTGVIKDISVLEPGRVSGGKGLAVDLDGEAYRVAVSGPSSLASGRVDLYLMLQASVEGHVMCFPVCAFVAMRAALLEYWSCAGAPHQSSLATLCEDRCCGPPVICGRDEEDVLERWEVGYGEECDSCGVRHGLGGEGPRWQK